jgi:hypothetical protein
MGDLMRAISKRAWAASPVLILAAVTMVAFQNCSQTQFTDASGVDDTVLASVEGEGSASPSSSQVDLFTPRIVLSDSMNGPARYSFSPQQTVYGTVYGVGESNIHVCIGHHNYCMSKPTDIWNYNSKVENLKNWVYNPVDRTWRFQISYADLGDMVNKISVHDMDRKQDTSTAGAQLHIENTIRIVSKPSDAKIYFAPYVAMPLFTSGMNITGTQVKAGNIFQWNDPRSMKIAGLGKDNVYVCNEIAGSGRCQSEGNWVRAEQKNLTWTGEGNFLAGTPFDIPAGGTYTYYAKSAETGATATGTITVKDKQIVCSMRSSTAVFGPCSDPESLTQCSQANVGQTVQGTGSCKVAYTCRCD